MKKKLFAAWLLLVALVCAQAADQKPQKGKLSRITPALVERFEGVITLQDGSEKDIEGIAFYFEISKINKQSQYLTISELRDFLIEGKSYAQLTKDDFGTEIEPDTEILSSADLIEEEPELKKKLKDKKKGFVMKTLIYGSPLPESGIVRVTLNVGWDSEMEAFDFAFNLADL